MSFAEENGSPKDDHNLVFYSFYFMGAVAMFPMGVISNAQTYWKYKFRDANLDWDPSRNTTTELQNEFTVTFTSASTIPFIISLVVAAIYTRQWNMYNRIMGCFITLIVVVTIITSLSLFNTDNWQGGFFDLTIVLVIILSCFSGLALFTELQLTARISPVYLTALVAGKSVSGLLSSALEILTLLLDVSPTASGAIYFSLALLFIICTLITFFSLSKFSPFLKHYLNHTDEEQNSKRLELDRPLICYIMRKQKYLLMTFFIITVITACISPGIISTVQSVNIADGTRWTGTFYGPVISFLVYNLMDLLGRQFALILECKNDILAMTMLILPIIFLPLIMMCNLTCKTHTSVVFESDTVFIVLIIAFAFSTGYLTNIVLLNIPRNYDNSKRGRNISLAFFALDAILATIIGNVFSMAVEKAL